MTTTPHEAPATDPHIDEVVESLERGLTLLKRRTRDVTKLAREREQLIAAIENRPSRVPVEPAAAIPDAETAVHGESSAFDLSDETPNFDPGDIDPLDESTPRTSFTTATDGEVHDQAPDQEAAVLDEPLEVHDTAVTDATEQPAEASETLAPADTGFTQAEAAETHDDRAASSSPASNKWARPMVEESRPARSPADDSTDPRDTVEPIEPLSDGETAATTEIDTWTAPASTESATASWENETAERGHAEPNDRAWETPDLEWSDEAEVGPQEFAAPADEEDDTWDHAADPVDEPGIEAADAENSPFAAEFEEHLEEVGGSLDAPFDLDTPPQQASYRPRSLQGARHEDAMPASSLLSEDRTSPPSQPTENLSAAWDDFAGRGEATGGESDEPARAAPSTTAFEDSPPSPPSSGSRLRDLVAQAQQTERERTEQEKSDFDLIHEDPSVSRYDKNSAKLPTVGISSEELSSSVAGLRSSLTGDKKSGPSSRHDDSHMSRADKKAEKKAEKEAAKAAKARAKRKRS